MLNYKPLTFLFVVAHDACCTIWGTAFSLGASDLQAYEQLKLMPDDSKLKDTEMKQTFMISMIFLHCLWELLLSPRIKTNMTNNQNQENFLKIIFITFVMNVLNSGYASNWEKATGLITC